MKTKKISLFYKLAVTDKGTELFPPQEAAVQRKEAWIDAIRSMMSKMGEQKIIKVTYELFNPEVEQQRKFFNGPVIDYYTIQSADLLSGDVPQEMHDRYREELLSDVLGFEVQMVTRKERRRKSTSDFISTQQWHDFLERVREEIFDPNGYEMPESEAFWELTKKFGYDQAKVIAIKGLQKRITSKIKSN